MKKLISLIAITTILLVGCSSTPGVEGEEDYGLYNRDFDLSLSEAYDRMIEEYEEDEATKIHFDKEGKEYKYKMDSMDDYYSGKFSIDANSGRMNKKGRKTRVESAEEKEITDQRKFNVSGVLSPRDAMEVALNENGYSGKVTDWVLEKSENNETLEYTVKIRKYILKKSYTVDAETGEFIPKE